jgi:hypothetical protein
MRFPHQFDRIVAIVSFLAFLFVCFMGGGLATYFRLPTYELIHNADVGHKAWAEKQKALKPPPRPGKKPHSNADAKPDKMGTPTVTREKGAYEGYTFLASRIASRAYLYDMNGKLVHQWHLPFSKIWPSQPPHISHPVPDIHVYWRNAYLYPNGDVLAVQEAMGDTPYGYGLAKMDKDSKLIWRYSENAHHWVDVAKDGTIYGLIQQISKYSVRDMPYLPSSILEDSVVTLSPDGKETYRTSLADAMLNSSYRYILREKFSESKQRKRYEKGDIMHANAVGVLRPEMAAAFPLFKAGQVLVSLRNLSTIAILDLPTHKIVWAARGQWKMQHGVQFAADGTILMFDNQGAGMHHSRVLKYNPTTKQVTVLYGGVDTQPLASAYFGTAQILPNKNTLITESMKGRILEVTPDKKIVWQFIDQYSSNKGRRVMISTGKRFSADQLPFMKN